MPVEVYRNTHSLGNGYYMKKIEWFEGGWGVKGLERHYDPQGRCVYTKEYDNTGNVYQTWRWYYDNGELAGVSDSNGFKQEFDWRGLPRK